MGRNSGGNRGVSISIGRKGFDFENVDASTVANSLSRYARVDKWNDNSSYRMGFEDDARMVIDNVAEINVGFASDIAKTVQKYNYKISDKQAFVIASAAIKNKIPSLLTRSNGQMGLKPIFQKIESKPKPKTVRQLQKASATAHMPKKDNIVAALKRRGLNGSQAWKVVNNNYASIAKQSAGGSTRDVIDLFMSKV